MNVLVVDGQGGQLGGQLIKLLKDNFEDIKIIAVGTNAMATSTMLKAGANQAATGENPLIVACRKADIIIGPIGIVIADSLWGEITPQMAIAVGQAEAVRILLPINKCDNIVAGISDLSTTTILNDVIEKMKSIIK
ncbi:MAG: DUF3842 family protein [Lachnospiraceae bacterium]|nr:DUF3842 family protein [Lachnospiraceae bacterium]